MADRGLENSDNPLIPLLFSVERLPVFPHPTQVFAELLYRRDQEVPFAFLFHTELRAPSHGMNLDFSLRLLFRISFGLFLLSLRYLYSPLPASLLFPYS